MKKTCVWTEARRVANGRHFSGWETECDNFHEEERGDVIIHDRNPQDWEFRFKNCPHCGNEIEVQA